jgi:hypothetical protein
MTPLAAIDLRETTYLAEVLSASLTLLLSLPLALWEMPTPALTPTGIATTNTIAMTMGHFDHRSRLIEDLRSPDREPAVHPRHY